MKNKLPKNLEFQNERFTILLNIAFPKKRIKSIEKKY